MTGYTTSQPRPVKVEATNPAKHVQHFTAEEEARRLAAFHCCTVNVVELHPPSRDFSLHKVVSCRLQQSGGAFER